MENSIGSRFINPGRRDPFRLQFGEPEEGDFLRPRKRRRRPELTDKNKYPYNRGYRHEGVQSLIYLDPRDDEYAEDAEWDQEVIQYQSARPRKFIGRHSGRRLRKIRSIALSEKQRKRVIFNKRIIPEYDKEFAEEAYNPNDYVERRYRAGYEGGYGYPRLGNYGPYGESAPEFESGLHGSDSASPYASGYQVGESYEGEHGYGSKEDPGGKRSV